MAGERQYTLCCAHGCELKPVMADQCVFHSRIERNLWSEVTKFLQSPEADQLVSLSRENRLLWALGIEQSEVKYSHDASPMKTHDKAFEILHKLKAKGLLPVEVDLNDREKTLNQLKTRFDSRIWIESARCFFSLDWVCATYEQTLVDFVKRQAERMAGVKRDFREDDEKRNEAFVLNKKMVDAIRHMY